MLAQVPGGLPAAGLELVQELARAQAQVLVRVRELVQGQGLVQVVGSRSCGPSGPGRPGLRGLQ